MDPRGAGEILLGAAIGASAAYLVWRVHPAWTLSLAVALALFSGNWERIGLPDGFSPDRLLLAAGVLAVLIRAPAVRDRAAIVAGPAQWLMAVLLIWVIGSSLAAGTLDERSPQFIILDRLGVMPLLLYTVAPVAFPDARRRAILLGTLVAMAAYLGITALLEALGLDGLVWPRYINDDSIGFHPDRARGPFVEAVTNGSALMVGALACLIALRTWRAPRARALAWGVGALCLAGLLFTETRSVWLGGAVAVAATVVIVPEFRRWAVPGIGAALAGGAVALALVPGLAADITERRGDVRTLRERENVNRAALNMIQERPLVGFGWGTFRYESADYFELHPDYALTGFGSIIHNVYLTYATETGLIGLTLWLLVVLAGVGAGLAARGPPDLRHWRIALGCYAIFFLIISVAVFPQTFPNLALWLLAGVATART